MARQEAIDLSELPKIVFPPEEENIFSNAVVWRNLALYLNYSDLKALRLTCLQFNQQIIQETNFRQRTLVRIENASLQEEIFGAISQRQPIRWKHFKIHLLCAMDHYHDKHDGSFIIEDSNNFKDNLGGATSVINNNNTNSSSNRSTEENKKCFYSTLLKSAESIHICSDSNFDYSLEMTLSVILKLLEATECLKSLALDVNIFNTMDNSNSSSTLLITNTFSEKVQRVLENLSEFQILSYNENTNLPFQTDIFGTGIMKNLQVIKISSDLEQDLDYDLQRKRNNATTATTTKVPKLLQIIEDNRCHLTKLHLEHPQLWTTAIFKDRNLNNNNSCYYGRFSNSNNTWESITSKCFPILQSVTIRANETECRGIIEFLQRHSKIREIDITILNQFPGELLAVISDKAKQLKRLRIKTKCFKNARGDMWNFLRNSSIEDFQLDFVFSDRYSPAARMCERIFMNFSNTIKRLTLRRFPDVGFLTGEQHLKYISPTNLTQLCLKKCAYLVFDGTLEYIFKNFKMLQVLELSECVNCTDQGFTGIDPSSKESTSSMKDLKGLKSLTITGCLFISDETCFSAIRFSELKYLDLSSNQCITRVGIMEVLRTNPTLEVLKSSEFDEFINDEIRVWHPRFQKHVFSGGSSDSDCGEGSLLGFRLDPDSQSSDSEYEEN